MVASPDNVSVFEFVVPPAILKPVAAAVNVKSLTVLFVSASVPASVDNVPAVGSVIIVLLVVFKVISAPVFDTPVVVKFLPVLILPPRVIVLPVLSIPVPPFAPKTIPVTLVALPNKFAVMFLALKSPLISLFTIVLIVFASVAAFARSVAVLIVEELDPPTVFTVGASAIPPKSPAS